MISARINQMLVLGACTIFVACGASTNDRGIASTTSDSTASGSAYNTTDGFAPAKPSTVAVSPAPSAASTTTVSPDTAATASVTVKDVATPTPAAAAVQPPTSTKPAAKAADGGADVKKGEALIAKSDCFACHKVDVKVLGPSYKDVAAKYPDNAATINQLVEKIKKGGSGVWGAIPMSPHPTLSDDDAKAMVKYILSLK